MKADRKGLISLRKGKDGTINCHTVRYNSLWWGRWKNKAKKVPILSLYVIPKYPSLTNHFFFTGYLNTWPKKKSNSLWRKQGKKEKKIRGGKGRSPLSEPQMPPAAHSNKPKCCILGIPRKKKTTAFLSYYCLLSTPQTQACQVENGCHQFCRELRVLPWQSEGGVL